MISNRQGGRRRGRGGQRGPNTGGNRQDHRQRGNATQLLEKYKNMARDAQLSGDRVQAEYYLQYAEHYFRVLDEGRSRSDDQRRQRGDNSSDDDENEEEMVDASGGDRSQDDGRKRGNGRERSNRNGAPKAEARPETEEERIALEALPPAIGRESGDEEEAPKPRRRTRRPRSDDGDAEIAPAA